jgi:hypothetical protein
MCALRSHAEGSASSLSLLGATRYLCDAGAVGRVDSPKSKKEQHPAMLLIGAEYGRTIAIRKGVCGVAGREVQGTEGGLEELDEAWDRYFTVQYLLDC